MGRCELQRRAGSDGAQAGGRRQGRGGGRRLAAAGLQGRQAGRQAGQTGRLSACMCAVKCLYTSVGTSTPAGGGSGNRWRRRTCGAQAPDSSCCRTSAALMVPSSPSTYLQEHSRGERHLPAPIVGVKVQLAADTHSLPEAL